MIPADPWMRRRPSSNDSLLVPLLSIGDEVSRRRAIQDVVTRHATPQICRLLDEQVARGELAAEDRQDLASEIVLRLLRKLQQLVEDPAAEPILRLIDYVGAITHHALDDYFRRRDPLRRRLPLRVR